MSVRKISGIFVILGLAAASAALAGCAVRNGDKTAGLDMTETGSISNSGAPKIASAFAGDNSDSAALLSGLASVQGDKTPAKKSWENSDTGATGMLSAYAEQRKAGATCRRFQTTRESYDGAALYHGEACKYGENPWALNYLKAE